MTLMTKTLMLTAEIAVIDMMSADGLSHLVGRAETKLLPVLEDLQQAARHFATSSTAVAAT